MQACGHVFGVLAFPSLLAPEHTQGSLCITVRKDVARGSLIIVNYLSLPVICLLFVLVTAEPVAQLVGGSAAGHHTTTWVFHGKHTGVLRLLPVRHLRWQPGGVREAKRWLIEAVV